MPIRDAIPMRAVLNATQPEPDLPADLVLRRPRLDDVEAVGELMVAAYAGTSDDELPAEHREEAVRTLTGHHGPVLWTASLLAASGKSLDGACLVTRWKDHPLLAHALVRPEWRGHGVGTAMISRSANLLRRGGEADWTLAVTRGSPAVALYRRLGFVEDPSLRNG